MEQQDGVKPSPTQGGKRGRLGLWLLCCALLFAIQEGGQWLGSQSWAASLTRGGLLWVVGGVGLALLSNGGGRGLLPRRNQPAAGARSGYPQGQAEEIPAEDSQVERIKP